MKKLTRHRKIILENMQSRKDHPTAKMVYDSIRSNVKSLSFATVYNSLEYLYNNGYIKKLDSFSDSAHYDEKKNEMKRERVGNKVGGSEGRETGAEKNTRKKVTPER